MPIKVAIKLTVVFITMLVILTACGGKPASLPSPTSASPSPAAMRAKGEQIYQKTAAGIGCQSCHGVDGKGSNLGPTVRGATADGIKRALGSDVMRFISMSEEDIQDVAVYLKYLESQP